MVLSLKKFLLDLFDFEPPDDSVNDFFENIPFDTDMFLLSTMAQIINKKNPVLRICQGLIESQHKIKMSSIRINLVNQCSSYCNIFIGKCSKDAHCLVVDAYCINYTFPVHNECHQGSHKCSKILCQKVVSHFAPWKLSNGR